MMAYCNNFGHRGYPQAEPATAMAFQQSHAQYHNWMGHQPPAPYSPTEVQYGPAVAALIPEQQRQAMSWPPHLHHAQVYGEIPDYMVNSSSGTSPVVTTSSGGLSSPEASSPVHGASAAVQHSQQAAATARAAAARSPYEWITKTSYQNQSNARNYANSDPVLLDMAGAQDTAIGKTRTKDKYRVVYTDHQRVELEKEFYYSRYITIRRKAELARELGLSERQVKIWFQNRRAKERKQMKKREEFGQREAPPAALVHGMAQQHMLHTNHPQFGQSILIPEGTSIM